VTNGHDAVVGTRQFDTDSSVTDIPDPAFDSDSLAVRPRRFAGFDGLRAIAAVSVILVHNTFISGFTARSSLGIYTSRLEIGVSIFFLISGFLLYRPFAISHLTGRSSPSSRRFWVRRLLRIVPAYWLALTVLTYIFHVVDIGPGIGNIVTHYLFLQIYFPTSVGFGIGQAWTLCTEMSFYLVLPLVAAVIGMRRKGQTNQFVRELFGIATLYLMSMGFLWWWRHLLVTKMIGGQLQANCYPHCAAHVPISMLMNLWLPAQLNLFALGMLLAALSAWWTERDSEPLWLSNRWMPWFSWIAAGLAFWCVSHLGVPTSPIFLVSSTVTLEMQALYGVFAFLLLLPAVFGPDDRSLVRRFLRCWPVASIGVVSYGIYLWHEGVTTQFMSWTGYSLFTVPLVYLFPAVFAISTVVACISYFGLEKPILRFKGRLGWWNRPPGPVSGQDIEVLSK